MTVSTIIWMFCLDRTECLFFPNPKKLLEKTALFCSIFGTDYFESCTQEPQQMPRSRTVCKAVLLQQDTRFFDYWSFQNWAPTAVPRLQRLPTLRTSSSSWLSNAWPWTLWQANGPEATITAAILMFCQTISSWPNIYFKNNREDWIKMECWSLSTKLTNMPLQLTSPNSIIVLMPYHLTSSWRGFSSHQSLVESHKFTWPDHQLQRIGS